MEIGAHTLNLFGINNNSNARPATAAAPQLSLLNTSESSDLNGVYEDPRLQKSNDREEVELATRTVEALKSVRDNELQDIKAEARASMSAALGRKLGETEDILSLTDAERQSLSSEVYKQANDARITDFFFSLSTGDIGSYSPRKFNIGENDLVAVEASGPKEAAERLIEDMVDMQINSITAARNTETGNEVVEQALGSTGVSDETALRKGLIELQWARFERGELSLSWAGDQIEYSEALFDAPQAAGVDRLS